MCSRDRLVAKKNAYRGRIWRMMGKEHRKEVKATEWAFHRIKEAFEQVAQDEARKMSIVQEIMIRSTDYLRRIIAPVGGQGGVSMSYLFPHCNRFSFEDTFGGSQGEKSRHFGGARSVERNTIGSIPTGFWSYKQVIVLSRPRYSKHMQCLRACAQI